MVTASGKQARHLLEELEQELRRERERALERGSIDSQWFSKTVRSVVAWLPETELTLIAALGGIVRSTSATRA